jgi:hypothetical protein
MTTSTLRTSIASLALLVLAQLPTAAFAQLGPGDDADPLNPGDPATGDTTPVDITQVETAILLLSGFHGIGDQAQFEAQLQQPQQTLWTIVRDPERLLFHRDRALIALAYWPSDELHAHLVTMLSGTSDDDMARHTAMSLLARGWGDQALPLLTPLLTDSDLQIRLTAVDSLRVIGTPAAHQALQTALPQEAHALVQQAIQEVLPD